MPGGGVPELDTPVACRRPRRVPGRPARTPGRERPTNRRPRLARSSPVAGSQKRMRPRASPVASVSAVGREGHGLDCALAARQRLPQVHAFAGPTTPRPGCCWPPPAVGRPGRSPPADVAVAERQGRLFLSVGDVPERMAPSPPPLTRNFPECAKATVKTAPLCPVSGGDGGRSRRPRGAEWCRRCPWPGSARPARRRPTRPARVALQRRPRRDRAGRLLAQVAHAARRVQWSDSLSARPAATSATRAAAASHVSRRRSRPAGRGRATSRGRSGCSRL